MNRYLNSDEAKRQYIEMMGNQLGSRFYELWNDVVWLFEKWNQYVILFGTKPLRIELLNQSASKFFGIVQVIFWENIILHISRLTDPPSSCGKPNLSLQSLINLLVDTKIKEIINKQIDEVKDKTEFCRDWRNRCIAHNDLNLMMGDEMAEPLKEASRLKVKEALASLEIVLNTITEYYMKSTIKIIPLHEPNGAEQLLYILNDGINTGIERYKRLESGKYLPDDLLYPPNL